VYHLPVCLPVPVFELSGNISIGGFDFAFSITRTTTMTRTSIWAESGLATHCKVFDEDHSLFGIQSFTDSIGFLYILYSNQ